MEKKKEVSKRPEQKDTNVETSGSVTGGVTIDGSKTVKVGQDRSVDTGGGFYIGGDVSTGGGDFVGRDHIADEYQVGGANISAGDMVGTGIGLSGQDLQQLFAPLIQTVQTVPPSV